MGLVFGEFKRLELDQPSISFSYFVDRIRHKFIMSKLFIVFLGLVATASAASLVELVRGEWHAFKVSGFDKTLQ